MDIKNENTLKFLQRLKTIGSKLPNFIEMNDKKDLEITKLQEKLAKLEKENYQLKIKVKKYERRSASKDMLASLQNGSTTATTATSATLTKDKEAFESLQKKYNQKKEDIIYHKTEKENIKTKLNQIQQDFNQQSIVIESYERLSYRNFDKTKWYHDFYIAKCLQRICKQRRTTDPGGEMRVSVVKKAIEKEIDTLRSYVDTDIEKLGNFKPSGKRDPSRPQNFSTQKISKNFDENKDDTDVTRAAKRKRVDVF